jgi:hypothetical protein
MISSFDFCISSGTSLRFGSMAPRGCCRRGEVVVRGIRGKDWDWKLIPIVRSTTLGRK